MGRWGKLDKSARRVLFWVKTEGPSRRWKEVEGEVGAGATALGGPPRGCKAAKGPVAVRKIINRRQVSTSQNVVRVDVRSEINAREPAMLNAY